MTFQISRTYTVQSAHYLPKVPEGHKCARLHGHTYIIEVVVEGCIVDGFVMDFGELDAIVAPVIEEADHRCLNDIVGLENPTSENLAAWLWERIEVKGLIAIHIRENPRSCVSLLSEEVAR